MAPESTPPSRARPPRVVAMTGASNWLGLGILRKLLNDPGCAGVVAIDVVRPPIEHPKLHFFKIDLTLPNAGKLIAKTFAREKVDALLHLLFFFSKSHNPALSHELETVGTIHMTDACAEAGIRKLVMRSTTFVYGAKPNNPAVIGENHPLADEAREGFVADKVEAEKLIKQFAEKHPDTAVTVLRDAITVGPTTNNYFLNLMGNPLVPVVAGYDPLFQFLHEDDAVNAYTLALEKDCPGVFNIAGSGAVRYSEARRLFGALGVPTTPATLHSLMNVAWALHLYRVPPAYAPFLKYSCVADTTRARDMLGFVPKYSSAEALADYVRLRG